MSAHWSVVVPFLRLAENSSRLGADAHALTRSIALDTVAAIADSTAVAHIVVVTDENDNTSELETISTKVAVTIARSLAPADAWAAVAATHGHVALVRAVLPALDGHELTALLVEAATVPLGVVTNAEDNGTTVLVAQSAAALSVDATDEFFANRVPTGAAVLDPGTTVRRTVTSARQLVQVRDWPTLGTRTRAAARAFRLEPPTTASDRRYRIDPPPAQD
ncbi:hypothetical protein [Microbacterium sp. NC79]|uniref:hypothetical protein n=1 Tax=Microbacterium sp. NC79 TaxID=2851009 RepID=UPI001C2C5911|nr:hypothetical protein [Microbacterium sp. NC79]MBV0895818.1 hypothetical protein [Microbacterium sp. NC79]